MSVIPSVLIGGTNSYPTPPQSFQPSIVDQFHDGVIKPVDYAVTAQGSPNMTVAVASGDVLVTATPTSESQRQFRVTHSASDNVTIAANASGSTKYDLVYVLLPAATLHTPPASGDFTAASTLLTERHNNSGEALTVANGYVLAEVAVSNGASSIVSGNITDRRTFAFDGWWNPGYTWTYASQTTPAGQAKTGTFTVSADVSLQLYKGTKIRFRQQGSNTFIYGYVIGTAVAAGVTTVTFVIDSASAFTNVAIYDPAFSYGEAPVGHPIWFVYAPNYSASASMTFTSVTTGYAKYKVSGSGFEMQVHATGTTGGTADSGIFVTSPLTMTAAVNIAWGAFISDGSSKGGFAYRDLTTRVGFQKYDVSNFGLGASRVVTAIIVANY